MSGGEHGEVGITRSVLVGVTVGVVVGVIAYLTPLVDDTYIYFDYVKTLVNHGHWGMQPDVFADTATAPLHVLYLSLWYVVAGHSVALTAALATVPPVVVAALFLLRTYPRNPVFAVSVLGVVVFLPPLISSVGMETWWIVAALTAIWFGLVRSDAGQRSIGVRAAIAGGGAAVIALRPDALLFVAPLALLMCLRDRRQLGTWAGAVVLVGAYCTLRWWLLGSVVPDSVWLKIDQAGTWGEVTFARGWWIFRDSAPAATAMFVVLAAVVVGAAAWALVRCRHRLRRVVQCPSAVFLIAAGIYALAVTWADIPPYHWYYVLPSVASILAVASIVAPGGATRRAWIPATAGCSVIAVVLGALWADAAARGQPVITTNWGSEQQLRELGTAIRPYVEGRRVWLSGEIGEVMYYCDCRLIDSFSESNKLRTQVDARRHGLSGLFVRADFHFRDWPVPGPRPQWLLTADPPRPGADVVYRQTVTGFRGEQTYSLIRLRTP